MALSRTVVLCIALWLGSGTASASCNSEDGDCAVEERMVSLLQTKLEVKNEMRQELSTDAVSLLQSDLKATGKSITDQAEAGRASVEHLHRIQREVFTSSPELKKDKHRELGEALKDHSRKISEMQKTLAHSKKQGFWEECDEDKFWDWYDWNATECKQKATIGEDCHYSEQCQNGDYYNRGWLEVGKTYCAIDASCLTSYSEWPCPGKCRQKETTGEACTDYDACADGFCGDMTYYPNVTAGKCSALKGEDGRCEWNQCAPELVCQYIDENHTFHHPGHCKPRGEENDPCEWNSCKKDLFCGWTSYPYKCTEKGDSGKPCGWDGDCKDNYHCEYNYTNWEGMCQLTADPVAPTPGTTDGTHEIHFPKFEEVDGVEPNSTKDGFMVLSEWLYWVEHHSDWTYDKQEQTDAFEKYCKKENAAIGENQAECDEALYEEALQEYFEHQDGGDSNMTLQ